MFKVIGRVASISGDGLLRARGYYLEKQLGEGRVCVAMAIVIGHNMYMYSFYCRKDCLVLVVLVVRLLY